MKKLVLLLVASVFIFSGCVMTNAPMVGSFVTNIDAQGEIADQARGKMVEGTATAEGILGVIYGDCSYETALKDALEKSGARSLKNIVVDYKIKNILWVYGEYTTVVRGVPVR